MNIVLIGYRGTGKTVVGTGLSKRLGRAFYDADAYIEKQVGRSISNMVAAEGWPFFRASEKEAIQELAALKDCVIATGGGAVMDKDNVCCLRNKGFFVLLTADINTMIERIKQDEASSQQRPKLLDSGSDLRKETEELIKQRMPTYQQVADLSVDTTSLIIDEVVETIMRHFSSMQGE